MKLIVEDLLKEDKVVKFGGEVYPKFGWCTIMLGGPGSGKSTAYNKKVPINAKKYDPDSFKEFSKKKSDVDGDIFILKNGKTFDPAEYGIKPPYDLSNPDVVTTLHKIMKPTTKKAMAQMLSDKGADKDRLPNIAFDIVGSDPDDVTSIVYSAKAMGYKVAVVWILAEVSVATDRRAFKAERRGMPSLIIRKHDDMYNALSTLIRDNIVEAVDDFWIVLDTISLQNLDGDYDSIKVANVFKVNSSSDLSDIDGTITDELKYDDRIKKYLDAFKSIRGTSREKILGYISDDDLDNRPEEYFTKK